MNDSAPFMSINDSAAVFLSKFSASFLGMHSFGISFHSRYPFAASATISGKPVETQSTALVIMIGVTDCTTALYHFFASTDDKLVGSLQPPSYGVRHARLTVGLLAIDILPLKMADGNVT